MHNPSVSLSLIYLPANAVVGGGREIGKGNDCLKVEASVELEIMMIIIIVIF